MFEFPAEEGLMSSWRLLTCRDTETHTRSSTDGGCTTKSCSGSGGGLLSWRDGYGEVKRSTGCTECGGVVVGEVRL